MMATSIDIFFSLGVSLYTLIFLVFFYFFNYHHGTTEDYFLNIILYHFQVIISREQYLFFLIEYILSFYIILASSFRLKERWLYLNNMPWFRVYYLFM